ncbi:galactose-binding domain-containing protein [Acidiphilium iwatense]|uniref:Discoidin domain-containing protein n=1 Tax=Acidiphilium iwatense TaxID=768198 RepID=A0ABS9DZR8_9PROT|nr:discoidin domain-containing protein [Acidiphilium iwatense]MCF3948241.1 discoidin domain-containing protein [Acidiphilium iwatense]
MIISVSPLDNLGNRMIEFMTALTLGRLVGEPVSYNCDLPEWGLSFDRELHDRLLNDAAGTLVISDKDATSILDMVALIRASAKRNVVFEGYFQRLDLFYAPDFYRRDIFPAGPADDVTFSDDEIVINVRSGDILNGVSWYPLVPVGFYRALVENTGLNPVFLGQLDDCAYVRAIRCAFPGARTIPSAGGTADFNRLRRARRICIAVSTFSWLAAWLSDAAEIHYPLLGFLHPACFRAGMHGLGGIDLAPADDPRYRFHLLPVLRGEPEQEYLDFTGRIDPVSKEVPRSLVRMLKSNTPILPRSLPDVAFDEAWYLKRYIDAAWEIGEGWYHDAAHHYAEVGRLRGYLPHQPSYQPRSANVALRRPARQSSLSPWSIGRTIEEDAGRAVDGDRDKDMAFHTGEDDQPWWMVDLGQVCDIECIDIYNRRGVDVVRKRVCPFAIELSDDGEVWAEVARTKERFDFGCETGRSPPWQWVGNFGHAARFVRVRVLKNPEFLHLAAVEVYGRAGTG